jgi:hypothetical protein
MKTRSGDRKCKGDLNLRAGGLWRFAVLVRYQRDYSLIGGIMYRKMLVIAVLVMFNGLLSMSWAPSHDADTQVFGNCGGTGHCECTPICAGPWPTSVEQCLEVPDPIEWSCSDDWECSSCCC